MSFRCRFFYPVIAITFALAAYSCSNTPPAGEGTGNPEPTADSGDPTSSADQVGSVPEDMLADEKGASTTASAAEEAAAPDPFADLQEKDGAKEEAKEEAKAADPQDAMTVSNEKSESGSEESASASSGKIGKYKVKAGDTLMKLAFGFYGDVEHWAELRDLNREVLKDNGNLLREGMQLKYEIPAQTFEPNQLAHAYEIKKGDTLANIADEVYGRKAKYKKLQGYNKHLIKNPNRIFAGFTIFYDITEKEVAEAEAHHAQRHAGGEHKKPITSALNPPAEAAPAEKKVASTPPPSASDNTTTSGPGSDAAAGPPSPEGPK